MLLFIAFDQKVRTSADWIYLVYSYGMSKKYRTRSWLITVNRRLRSSKAIVLKRSSTLIFARHRSLSKYLNMAFRTDSLYVSRCAKTNMVRWKINLFHLPWLFVLSIRVAVNICLRESVLAQLNALLDSILDLEHVYWGLIWGACDDVQSWMENDILYNSVTGSTSKGLQGFTAIGAEYLDDSATLRSWCDKCPVGVNTQGTQFSLMCLNHAIHAIFGNYRKSIKISGSFVNQTYHSLILWWSRESDLARRWSWRRPFRLWRFHKDLLSSDQCRLAR